VRAGTRKVKPEGKTTLDLLEQKTVSGSGSGQCWAICKSAPHPRQTTMPTSHHSGFFTGQMPFLPPNQQHQSTEGINNEGTDSTINSKHIDTQTTLNRNKQ